MTDQCRGPCCDTILMTMASSSCFHGRLITVALDAIEPLATHPDVTAGGMPDRVKCLHVHVAHALAAGAGVNPFGDEALDEIGEWWRSGPPCL